MKLIIKSILISLVIFSIITPVIVMAATMVNGKATISFDPGLFSSKPSGDDKSKAISKAKRGAWDKYTQGFSASKMKSYRQIESSIVNDLDEYFIETNIIDEKIDKDSMRYSIIIRVTINTAKFEAKLAEISNAGSQRSGSGSLFSFIFVARQESSVKSFDAKRTSIEMKESKGFEKEEASQNGDTALGSHDYKSIKTTTTGGSTVRKSNQIEYRILSAKGIDTSMNQELTASGFEVVSYEDVVSECGGTEPSEIKQVFTKSNEIPRMARKNAIKGARECEVSYFAVGTLDVGIAEIDPASGNQRVYVSVKAQVWNIDKRLPRQIASVGPVQYQGLGPNAQVAQNNALVLAAKNAANEIVNQLNAKGLH